MANPNPVQHQVSHFNSNKRKGHQIELLPKLSQSRAFFPFWLCQRERPVLFPFLNGYHHSLFTQFDWRFLSGRQMGIREHSFLQNLLTWERSSEGWRQNAAGWLQADHLWSIGTNDAKMWQNKRAMWSNLWNKIKKGEEKPAEMYEDNRWPTSGLWLATGHLCEMDNKYSSSAIHAYIYIYSCLCL